MPAEVWLVPPVVIIAAILAVGVALHRARLRRYRAIAARTGLAVTPGIVHASQVHGTYGGRQLVMTTASPRPRGFFRHTWTRVFVQIQNPAFVAFRLRRRDVFDRLLRLGNAPVNDADFDRRFVILSGGPRWVPLVFGAQTVREALVAADVQAVRLTSSWLEVFSRREERSPDHAVLLFDATVRLADAIDRLGDRRS